jgi:hypothetical protein
MKRVLYASISLAVIFISSAIHGDSASNLVHPDIRISGKYSRNFYWIDVGPSDFCNHYRGSDLLTCSLWVIYPTPDGEGRVGKISITGRLNLKDSKKEQLLGRLYQTRGRPKRIYMRVTRDDNTIETIVKDIWFESPESKKAVEKKYLTKPPLPKFCQVEGKRYHAEHHRYEYRHPGCMLIEDNHYNCLEIVKIQNPQGYQVYDLMYCEYFVEQAIKCDIPNDWDRAQCINNHGFEWKDRLQGKK